MTLEPMKITAAELQRHDSLSLRGPQVSALITVLGVKRCGDVVTVRTGNCDYEWPADYSLEIWRD